MPDRIDKRSYLPQFAGMTALTIAAFSLGLTSRGGIGLRFCILAAVFAWASLVARRLGMTDLRPFRARLFDSMRHAAASFLFLVGALVLVNTIYPLGGDIKPFVVCLACAYLLWGVAGALLRWPSGSFPRERRSPSPAPRVYPGTE